MQTSKSLRSIGPVIERCIYRTTVHFVRTYYPTVELPDAVAQHVRVIETTVSERPGGLVHITVCVLARKKHNDTSHHFKFQRTGPACYVSKGDTIPQV